MKKGTVLMLSCFVSLFCSAQFSRYIVQFKEKNNSPYSFSEPSKFLSARALERRKRYNIPLDSTDLPINPRYIDSVRLSGNVSILTASRWLNQISIQTNDFAALDKINRLPFVMASKPIAAKSASVEHPDKTEKYTSAIPKPKTATTQNALGYVDYGLSNGQITIHQGEFLHNHGFRGEGMRIAMLDDGFLNYDKIPTFDSVRKNNQILDTWDFVEGEANVEEDNLHGTYCLSTIAANMPGLFVGTAPKTGLYLFRTEDVNSEYPIEEHNLAAGAERADSSGADVCSISLGYSTFNDPIFDYTYADMDGKTTMSARAANIASSKGMLMTIAVGNEGNQPWRYVATPGDADSCLSVGAVDVFGQSAGFSSFGPNSSGKIKPSVAAVGLNAVIADHLTGQPLYNSGTSFACPNMAGLTTCLWQAFPEVGNMELISVLQQSASASNNPNDRIGYGIPDMKKAFVILQKKYYTKNVRFFNCSARLNFWLKTDSSMVIHVERKLDNEQGYTLMKTFFNNEKFGMRNYTYTDNLLGTANKSVEYRLKVMIGSDTTYYLDSVKLNYRIPCFINIPEKNDLKISPNPVNDFLTIQSTRTTKTIVNILIQNSLGQKIYTHQYTQEAGTIIKPVDFSKFSKGMYFVTVLMDNRREKTVKIVRQ